MVRRIAAVAVVPLLALLLVPAGCGPKAEDGGVTVKSIKDRLGGERVSPPAPGKGVKKS